MSSKGAITITQDELTKMKMRANLIPTGNLVARQVITNRIVRTIFIKRVRNVRTSGLTTSKISRRGRRKKDLENFRRRSLKDEELIKKRKSFSSKLRKSNWQKLTKSSFSRQSKCVDSIASCYSLILYREDRSK